MRKVGILGGTFNPIHNGHLAIAENAYVSLSLDEVMFIPTGISYLKSGLNVLSKEHRLTMTELAVKNISYFSVSDIEIKRAGNTYTKDTLIELRNMYDDTWFYFIGGSDTLFNIEKWYEPQTILDNCTLVALNRGEYLNSDLMNKRDDLIGKFNADIIIIDSEKIDISSTDARRLISNKQFDIASKLLPKEVFDYIILNKLYCDNE